MDLGYAMLEETASFNRMNTFGEVFQDFLFEHQFHRANLLTLQLWLVGFLGSLTSSKSSKILSSHVDTVKNQYITFLIVNDKNETKSFVFYFGNNDPFVNDTNFNAKLSLTVRNFASRLSLSVSSTHNHLKYHIDLQYDTLQKERTYKIEKSVLEVSDQYVFQPFPQPLPKMLGIGMPEINHLFSSLTKTGNLSIIDILAGYFGGKAVMGLLEKLSTTLTSRFLILALHAALMGNSKTGLQLHSKLKFDLSGDVSSLNVYSENLCLNMPIVFWSLESVEKITAIPRVTLAKTSDFETDNLNFLSVNIQCRNWECLWRTKENKNRPNYVQNFMLNSDWDETTTNFFLNSLKDTLEAIPGVKIGKFLYAYFQDNKFTELFTLKLARLPNLQDNYFSFILCTESSTALILNVVDDPETDINQENFEWLSNIADFDGEFQPNTTQVVNILPESDSRINRDDKNFAMSTFFLPGYHVSIEKKFTTKSAINHQYDSRATISLWKFAHIDYRTSVKSVENFAWFITSIIRFNLSSIDRIRFGNHNDFLSLLHGTISRQIQPYTISGTKIVGYKILDSDVNDEQSTTSDFVTILVKEQTNVDFTPMPETTNVVNSRKIILKIHQITIYVDKIDNLHSATICRPKNDRKTVCSKVDKFFTENPNEYEFTSVVTIDKNTVSNTPNENSCDTSSVNMFKPTLNYFKPDIYFPNGNALRITAAKIHNCLLYSMLGKNMEQHAMSTLKQFAKDKLANFVNLTRDFYNETDKCSTDEFSKYVQTFHLNFPDNLSTYKKELDKILHQMPGKLTFWENLEILPIDDGFCIGLVTKQRNNDRYRYETISTENDQAAINSNNPSGNKNVADTVILHRNGTEIVDIQHYMIFAMKDIQSIRGHEGENIVLLGEGSKAINTDQNDDIIFVEKTSNLDGFINAKQGTDTVILSTTDSEVSVRVTSEENQLLTIESQHDNSLTILGAENLWGAKNSPDILHLKCGLKFVNLQGGLNSENVDEIYVDLYECNLDEITVIAQKYTEIHHTSGHPKLKYRYLGDGPVLLINLAENKNNETSALVSIDFPLSELTNLTITESNSNKEVKYTKMTFQNNIEQYLSIKNFDQSIKIGFKNGYNVEMKRNHLYITRDCTVSRERFTFSDHLYEMLANNRVVFVEKCAEATIVHVGEKIYDNFHELIDPNLPPVYKKLENDPETETQFKNQDHGPINACVFSVNGNCKETNAANCPLTNLRVDLNKNNIFDLRKITTIFEDENFDIVVNKEVYTKTHQNVIIIRINAEKSGHSLVPLVHIRLENHVINNDQSISIITTRYQLEFDANQDKFEKSFLTPNKNADALIVVDYKSRWPVFRGLIEESINDWRKDESDHDKQHGDDHVILGLKAYERDTSAILLSIEKNAICAAEEDTK